MKALWGPRDCHFERNPRHFQVAMSEDAGGEKELRFSFARLYPLVVTAGYRRQGFCLREMNAALLLDQDP